LIPETIPPNLRSGGDWLVPISDTIGVTGPLL